jgi:hypothetical protein
MFSRFTLGFAALAATSLAFLTGARGAIADPPSPAERYAQAIAAMSDVVQPPYVAYRLEATSEGLEVGVKPDATGQIWLDLHGGDDPATWTVSHRTIDYSTEILSPADGRRYVTQRSFFDPTWYGAYRALRQGMLYSQDPAPPRTSLGGASPPPPGSLKTIGVVAVMGRGMYRIKDRGAAACPNGDPGWELRLIPREVTPEHQLAEVVIDDRSSRFCMLRFASPPDHGFDGIVEQHYAQVGDYWVQTDGFVEGALHGVRHGVWRYRLVDMRFPATLPDAAFVPEASQSASVTP